MFRGQFPEPNCIGAGAESMGPVDGSPVFISFSGVTLGNRAVTGHLSFGLLQKLSALVHRSRVVPCHCFDPNFTGNSFRQIQRQVASFTQGDFALNPAAFDPEHDNIALYPRWPNAQPKAGRVFRPDRVFNTARWGGGHGFFGQVRANDNGQLLDLSVHRRHDEQLFGIEIGQVLVRQVYFLSEIPGQHVPKRTFGEFMPVSLMPQSPVGIISDARVFGADWLALQPLQELLVVWVVAGPHGEIPQAWCSLSGDVGLVSAEVFRELRNGCRGVNGRAGGEIEDCPVAAVGAASCNLAAPHKCTAAAFGRNEDEIVILIFHDETLSVGWRHGEGRVAFTY